MKVTISTIMIMMKRRNRHRPTIANLKCLEEEGEVVVEDGVEAGEGEDAAAVGVGGDGDLLPWPDYRMVRMMMMLQYCLCPLL